MSEFILQIEKLFSAFSDPEYHYLLLEPLIFYGILIGVGMLITGFFMKARRDTCYFGIQKHVSHRKRVII